MRQHVWGVPPPQTVIFQMQPLHDRADRGEGIKRSAQVVDEAGRRDLCGLDCPAGDVAGFENNDRPAAVGEQVRGNQPVMAGTDDHRVGGRHHRARVPSSQGINRILRRKWMGTVQVRLDRPVLPARRRAGLLIELYDPPGPVRLGQ
jgi:hypothetical protein